MVLVFVFVFCWTPYAIVSMFGILGFSSKIPVIWTVVPNMMAKERFRKNCNKMKTIKLHKVAILWRNFVLFIFNSFDKWQVWWTCYESVQSGKIKIFHQIQMFSSWNLKHFFPTIFSDLILKSSCIWNPIIYIALNSMVSKLWY